MGVVGHLGEALRAVETPFSGIGDCLRKLDSRHGGLPEKLLGPVGDLQQALVLLLIEFDLDGRGTFD